MICGHIYLSLSLSLLMKYRQCRHVEVVPPLSSLVSRPDSLSLENSSVLTPQEGADITSFIALSKSTYCSNVTLDLCDCDVLWFTVIFCDLLRHVVVDVECRTVYVHNMAGRRVHNTTRKCPVCWVTSVMLELSRISRKIPRTGIHSVYFHIVS